MMIGMCPVLLRPIAKHTLFDHPAMAPLLRLSRAIGVKRVQDMKIEIQSQKKFSETSEKEWRTQANSQAFKSVVDGLHQGDNILIFPEGISHDEPFVHPFKTGMVRMALQAVTQPPFPEFSVVIQPVALDYFEKDEFRSDVAIHFCEPVLVTLPDVSIEEVNQAVYSSLVENLAQFKDWNEKRNWMFVFEVAYGRPAASAREFKLFVQEHRELFEANQTEWAKLQTFRRLLSAWEIPPHSLVWGEAHELKRSFYKLMLVHGPFHLLVAGPVVSMGNLFWYIPIALCGFLADVSTKERDVVATMKLAHGSYILPLWVICQGVFAMITFSWLIPVLAKWNAFLLGVMVGPALLIFRILAEERTHFFPGYWRLAKLRLFFPRGWREVMTEWRDVCTYINAGLKARTDKQGLEKVLHVYQHKTKLTSKWLKESNNDNAS